MAKDILQIKLHSKRYNSSIPYVYGQCIGDIDGAYMMLIPMSQFRRCLEIVSKHA